MDPGPAQMSGSEEDLDFLIELLEDPAVPPTFRREAVTRLARTTDFRAGEVIARVLRSENDEIDEVVLEGLRMAAPLPRSMIKALVGLVEEGTLAADSVVQVVGGASPESVRLVVDRIGRLQEGSRRIRLYDLLGRMGDPLAPSALVDAIERVEDESEIAAIDAALQRWSNMKGRLAPPDWRAWWNGLSMDGDESQGMRRLANRIAAESTRAATAESRASEAESRADRLAVQIVELHARLIALLPEAEPVSRVQGMLRDDEGLVRLAAIGQIERMLQDARVLPEGISQDLVLGLEDSNRDIRMRSAKVLDAMGAADFAEILVRSLQNESDPEVIQVGLRVLGSRPRPEAVPFAVERLRDPDGEIERLAARVIASVAMEGALDQVYQEQVRRRFAEDRGSIDTRDEGRLAVLLADDPDAEISLLVDEKEAVRRGAAEAYRTLGRRDLLLTRSANETVSRVAIQAWAATDDSVGQQNIRALLLLRPDPTGPDAEVDVSTWRSAMTRVLEAMPVGDIASSEKLLADDADLIENRCAMLRRGTTPESTLDPTGKIELHTLLGRNLLTAGRPLEAAVELRAAGGGEPDSSLRAELFTALLLAEEWDEASGLEPEPESWIAFLENRLDLEAEFAGRLADEIDRRFEGRLEEPLVIRIDVVRDRFAPVTTLGG